MCCRMIACQGSTRLALRSEPLLSVFNSWLLHHLFAWPAFALLVALATWRIMLGCQAPRSTFTGYLTAVVIAAGLISIAGYWGGEMLIAR